MTENRTQINGDYGQSPEQKIVEENRRRMIEKYGLPADATDEDIEQALRAALPPTGSRPTGMVGGNEDT